MIPQWVSPPPPHGMFQKGVAGAAPQSHVKWINERQRLSARKGEEPMPSHKFKVGDLVAIKCFRSDQAAPRRQLRWRRMTAPEPWIWRIGFHLSFEPRKKGQESLR